MDLINQYRKANGKSSIERDNTRELMAITRAGEISVYYNAMRPSGTAGSDLIIGFYDEDKDATIDTWFNKLDPDLKKLLLDDQWKSGWVSVFRNEAGYCYVAVDFYTTATQGSTYSKYSEGEYTLAFNMMDKCLNVKGLLCDKNVNLYNKNTLTKGATYYYVVMNYNQVEDVNLFHSQTTKSSLQHQGDFCHPGWHLEGKISRRREGNRQAGGRFRTVHVQNAGGSAEQGDRREADREEKSHEGCVEEDCGSIRIQGIPGNFQEGKVQMRQDRIFKNNFLHQQEAEEEQEILL